MKQVVLNIPDNKYIAFINHIKSKFSDIQIKEKESNAKDLSEVDSSFDLMLLSENSLAKDWLLPEEDEAWKDL